MTGQREKRLKLQAILENILGSRHVYFQPPPTIQMTFPCIVYKREGDETERADNLLYSRRVRYSVTYIDRNPDVDIHEKIMQIPYSAYDRYFSNDGLNHDVFTIFF